MPDLRYPSDVAANGMPYMLFTTHKARYNSFGNSIKVVPTDDAVALYLPIGLSFEDQIVWHNESNPLVTALFQNANMDNWTWEDVKGVANSYKQQIAAIGGGFIGYQSGVIAGIVGAVGGASVIDNVMDEVAKKRQKTLNPKEYALFKSPSLRDFDFDFNFIPKSPDEARAVPEIIKFFRMAAYPTIETRVGIEYTFPKAFNINIGGQSGMMRLPEVVCTGIGVKYNPSSQSFFRVNNQPVEVNLSLTFKEIQAINSHMVEVGY